MERSGLRKEASVWIALALTVWAAVSFCQGQHATLNGDPFQIARQSAFLEGVRQLTPEDAVLGFITDTTEQQGTIYPLLYFATQYALAPRLVLRGADYHFVVGMFRNQALLGEAAGQHHLRLVKYFGNGIAVFENEGR